MALIDVHLSPTVWGCEAMLESPAKNCGGLVVSYYIIIKLGLSSVSSKNSVVLTQGLCAVHAVFLSPAAGIAELLLDIRCEGFPWCWNHYLGVICSGGSCGTSCLHMGTARNINFLIIIS